LTGYSVEPIEVVTRVETHTELLLAARTAHVRRDWHASYEAFVRASEAVPLNTDDLDALAVAAWRLGRGKESVRAAERVFTQLARTDPSSAAMKAVELGLAWIKFAASATYGGVCDVHRLQLLAATDDYRRLEDRLAAVSRSLEDVNIWAAGEGYYPLGEVRKLLGDDAAAFAAFARARELGTEPQPGEALLRCRMGPIFGSHWQERTESAGCDCCALRYGRRIPAARYWRRRDATPNR